MQIKISKAEALKAFENSARQLAYSLGISVQAVHQWPEFVPIRTAVKLIRLRPDLWESRLPKLLRNWGTP